MDHNFWHERWRNSELGFHEGDANCLLVEHFEKLSLKSGSRIFVPLCGKTRDIAWLLGQGHRVAGAELSTTAVQELFAELGIEPDISRAGSLVHYNATDIDIYAGDIFDLESDQLGPVHAVYDRAALVALPDAMRPRYATHLINLTATAPQLLICFEYDQQCLEGPPFSIMGSEIMQHYGNHLSITKVASRDVTGGLKGKYAAIETAWLMDRIQPIQI